MRTSVIIATKNRAADFSRTLQTLLVQTHLPEEIVIIDQSPDDSTKKAVERLAEEICGSNNTKPGFVYIYDQSLIGVGAARNIGIERSSGDVLLFLDDDVILEPNFLAEMLGVYDGNPNVGGVSGVITNYPRGSLRERIIEEVFRLGSFRDERQRIYWNADRLRNAPPIRVRKFGGGLMSVKRSMLKDVRFDGNYRGAGSEDIDFSWRLSNHCALLMTPRARLLHVRTQAGGQRDHWVKYEVECNYYMYYRNWNSGIANRLCFLWLNLGYVLLAAGASTKRRSLEPWRAFRQGVRWGREQAALSEAGNYTF